MKLIVIISILSVMALSATVEAQDDFYKYVDQYGNVIYTDDLSKVPVDQRSRAKAYEASQYIPPKKEKSLEKSSTAVQNQDREALSQEGRQLSELKKKLDAELKALAQERAQLQKDQEAAATPDQFKRINKRVVNYNTRFKAFKEKEAAYRTQLANYNTKLVAADGNTSK